MLLDRQTDKAKLIGELLQLRCEHGWKQMNINCPLRYITDLSLYSIICKQDHDIEANIKAIGCGKEEDK
jgi:hypothetical protein